MSDRVKDLEKALADAKAEANQIRRTTKFEEVKKYIGLVYYYAHVSPRDTGFSLIHIKNIILKDNDRLESHQDEITCSLSPHCNNIAFGKNIEYYDLYSFYPGFMRSSTTVSLDVFKKMKHRAKISVKSFMEIMKTLTELKIPIIPADNMSEDHMKFDVDFPHIKLDNLMGFFDHTPFTIGNKYLLTPKSVEFAYAKIRAYREKDAVCSGLYEPCDSAYLQRMHEVITFIDRQLLNFTTKSGVFKMGRTIDESDTIIDYSALTIKSLRTIAHNDKMYSLEIRFKALSEIVNRMCDSPIHERLR